jgi:hypothetical protein
VWSSLSCSSVSTTSSSVSAAVDVADPLVRIELEAAEALADLAYLAVRASGGREWGSKGKRARKRVKSESPPGDSALKLNRVVDSVPSSSDLAEVSSFRLLGTVTFSFFFFFFFFFLMFVLKVLGFCIKRFCLSKSSKFNLFTD